MSMYSIRKHILLEGPLVEVVERYNEMDVV